MKDLSKTVFLGLSALQRILKIQQHLALFFRKLFGHFDVERHVQIAPADAAQPRHALPFQAENGAGLGALWHMVFHRLVDGGHDDIPAQGRADKGNIHLHIQIRAAALKDLVRADGHYDVDVAGRASLRACLALARDGDDLPIVDAGGDVYLDLALFILHALAAAVRAGVLDDLPRTAADRASRNIHHLAQRGALYGLHLPRAAAMGTGFGVGALFGACAAAGGARFVAPDVHLLCHPFVRLLQINGDVHPQAAPAPGAGTARRLPAEAAENRAENILEPAKAAAETARAGACAAGRLGKGVMAHRIVLAALFRIAQYAVRLVDLFELFLRLGRLVSLIHIRVILFCQLAIRFFNICL